MTSALKSLDLINKQIAGKIVHFEAIEKQAKKIQSITTHLQGRFKDQYFSSMKTHLRDKQGPLEIYSDTWLTIRYSSIRPTDIQWGRYLQLWRKLNDFIFHLISLTALIPNYHSKVKARGPLYSYISDAGWPIGENYSIFVHQHSLIAVSNRYRVLQEVKR